MGKDGYAAFVAWCIKHDVEPVTREQFETWTMPRFQRHMNKLLGRRAPDIRTFNPPPLF